MAVVESHDCNWEASGCVRRFFLVCLWYDLRASWKIAWKCEAVTAVSGVWDMKRPWEDEGADGVTRRIGDGPGMNEQPECECEHWPRGAGASQPRRAPGTIDARYYSPRTKYLNQELLDDKRVYSICNPNFSPVI